MGYYTEGIGNNRDSSSFVIWVYLEVSVGVYLHSLVEMRFVNFVVKSFLLKVGRVHEELVSFIIGM